MSSPLFRPEVIEANRERLAGTVVAATPPGARIYVLVILAVAAALAGTLLFGNYASQVEVRGVVAYDRGIARVYANTAGEIRQVHVQEGQRVADGAPLVTLALAQGPGGVADQLEQLQRRDEELIRQQQLTASLASAASRASAQQRSELAAAIGSLERQRTLASGQIGLAEAESQRSVQLEAEGAATRRQVESANASLLSRRGEVESIAERISSQRQAMRTLEASVAQQLIEASRTESELAGQRASIAEQRSALSRQNGVVLTAPVQGEVVDVAAQIGRRAVPETALVTIVPTGSHQQVWLYAPSRAVGFVRPGQEVHLQFDAFPHQTYGLGAGRVVEASRVAVEPSSIESVLNIQEPVFRIRVNIDRLPPRVALAASRLRPGMTLSANLVLQRRSLWEALFNPIAAAFRR